MKFAQSTFVAAVAVVALIACGRKEGDQRPIANEAGAARSSQPAGASTPNAPKVLGSLDSISGNLTSKGATTAGAGSSVTFIGWLSTPGRELPSKFDLVLKGPASHAFAGATGVSRIDVARRLKANALSNCGFKIDATLNDVAPGEYSIFLVQDWRGEKVEYKTRGKLIVTAN